MVHKHLYVEYIRQLYNPINKFHQKLYTRLNIFLLKQPICCSNSRVYCSNHFSASHRLIGCPFASFLLLWLCMEGIFAHWRRQKRKKPGQILQKSDNRIWNNRGKTWEGVGKWKDIKISTLIDYLDSLGMGLEIITYPKIATTKSQERVLLKI